jgi:hypothetical protein
VWSRGATVAPTLGRLGLKEFIDPNARRGDLLLARWAQLLIEAGKVLVEFCDLGQSIQFFKQCR